MPKVYALTCPHCRAPLPALAPGQTQVRCEYCDRDANVAHTLHMPVAAPPPALVRVAPPAARVAAWVITVVVAISVVGVSFALRGAQRTRAVTSASQLRVLTHWSGLHVPQLADVDGDGTEDIVGVFRVLEYRGADMTTNAHVGAYSGRTWKRLWATRSLGETDHDLRFGIVGASVLVGDGQGALQRFALATGALQWSTKLADRAIRFCALDADRAWVERADESSFELVLATGGMTPAPRPAACPVTGFARCVSWDRDDHEQPTGATCFDTEPSSDVKVPDMSVSYALRAGAAGIAVGTKAKGTAIAMLAGFDPGAPTGPPRWVRRVDPDPSAATTIGYPRGVDIAHGMLLVIYSTGSTAAHVQVADPLTGAIRWDVPLRAMRSGIAPDKIIASPSRVYVPHDQRIEVFDAATGKVLGALAD